MYQKHFSVIGKEGSTLEWNDFINNLLENANNIKLAGAVFDYNCPEENGQLYLFFPIKRL